VPPPAEENDRTVSVSTRGRGERILVVDDEPRMRDVAAGVLARAGYRVTEAESPERALEMLAGAAEPFDLLLTDIVMPRIDGRVLAQRARERRPGLAVLFMTGYADLPPGGVPLEIPPEGLLDKPFSARELSRKVRAALDARDSATGGAQR
jgi:CheY-like chemotaxis protein